MEPGYPNQYPKTNTGNPDSNTQNKNQNLEDLYKQAKDMGKINNKELFIRKQEIHKQNANNYSRPRNKLENPFSESSEGRASGSSLQSKSNPFGSHQNLESQQSSNFSGLTTNNTFLQNFNRDLGPKDQEPAQGQVYNQMYANGNVNPAFQYQNQFGYHPMQYQNVYPNYYPAQNMNPQNAGMFNNYYQQSYLYV